VRAADVTAFDELGRPYVFHFRQTLRLQRGEVLPSAIRLEVENPSEQTVSAEYLVQARLENWDISIKPGTEASSPTAPNPDSDCIALAQLFLRPGMTVIKNTDDSTNGYIIDARNYI